MRNSSRSIVFGVAGIAVFAGACTDGDPVGPPPNALDIDLTRAVQQAGGVATFILPSSQAYHLIPQDPSNPITDSKVELGRHLLHETALGVNNLRDQGREGYSCAACHVASAGFLANVPQGIGEGGKGFGVGGEGRTAWLEAYGESELDVQPIRPPSILNSAYQPLKLWDGSFGGVAENLDFRDRWIGPELASNELGLHGLETQAHAGLAVHRMRDVHLSRVAELEEYRAMFGEAFPGEEEPINRLNAAFAIAAYERTLLANRAPWQRWLTGERDALTDSEKRGAILFLGEAGCVGCHSGPALTSMSFHALGMADLDGSLDPSRVNLTRFGGNVPDGPSRGRGGFTGRPEDDFKFKTPQLYNLGDARFLGHGSSFQGVRDVIEYKNRGVPQKDVRNLSPLFRPLGLTPSEIDDLTAFVSHGLHDPDLTRYLPNRLPSGNCIGVNDPTARADLGC